SKSLRPLVSSGDRIRLGETGDDENRIWILADPDILANRGLVKSQNAKLAVALIDLMRKDDGPIVFDEALHDVEGTATNVLKILLRFPYAAVTILVLAATGLLLWAAIPRFGPAEPADEGRAAGKRGLIE